MFIILIPKINKSHKIVADLFNHKKKGKLIHKSKAIKSILTLIKKKNNFIVFIFKRFIFFINFKPSKIG